MKTIIFVCHGNICRSVAAEFIMKKMLLDRHLENDFKVFSRATSMEEIGNDIYPPMKRELIRRGIPFSRHFAERISQRDYELADYIFYMDEHNKSYLDRIIDDYKHIVFPVTMYEKDINMIEDPWYTDRFEKVCNQLEICIDHIINELVR